MKVIPSLVLLLLSPVVASATPAVFAAYHLDGKTASELKEMTADRIKAEITPDWVWATNLTPGASVTNQFTASATKVKVAATPKTAPHNALSVAFEIREEVAQPSGVAGVPPAVNEMKGQVLIREGTSVMLGGSNTTTTQAGVALISARFYVLTLATP